MTELPPGWAETTLGDVADDLDSRTCPQVKPHGQGNEARLRSRTTRCDGTGRLDRPSRCSTRSSVLEARDGAPFLDRSKDEGVISRGTRPGRG